MNRIAEALCAALREGPAGASPNDLTGLTPAEWHEVAALAIRQRVGPLLYSRARLPMPDDVRALLRARAEVSARRALMQQAAFRELAAAIAPLGISLMALKGLHLATSVYASAALREMDDIDVMVRPEHVEAVSVVVRQLGYRPMSEVPVAIALKALHHVPGFRRGSVSLEVHWRLALPGTAPTVEPDELWRMARPTALAANARTLTPEASLVHICAHAGTHYFEQGLRPMCDVQAIVARSGNALSWPLVIELARRWSCERSMALVLSLAQDAFGVCVPDEVLDARSDQRPPREVLSVAMTLTLSGTREIYETTPAAGELLSMPGTWAKLRHLRDRIWLPEDLMATKYPDSGTGGLAKAGVTARRVSVLLRRHAWNLLRLATQRKSTARATLDRRNALITWLRDR